MEDTYRRVELIADLRARLAQSVETMLAHAPHGCGMVLAMQGAAYAYADFLAAIGAGPAPGEGTSLADVMQAHGIPGPWDTDTDDTAPVPTPDDVVRMVSTFASELDTVSGIGPDGEPFYGPPLS